MFKSIFIEAACRYTSAWAGGQGSGGGWDGFLCMHAVGERKVKTTLGPLSAGTEGMGF